MFGFPRLSRLLSIHGGRSSSSPAAPKAFIAAVSLATMVLSAGCTCGSGPYEGDYYDGERPAPLKDTKFIESEKGDPKLMGCADGQREGFADLAKNPRVAGCLGEWDGTKSLRDAPTGKACGDDGEKCAVPADVCAPGWHVCGMDGKGKDITDRTTPKDCDNAGPGRFNAAVSHSISEEIDPCPKITAATTLPCFQAGLGSEPACCGNDCLGGKCKDGVFKGKTRISRGPSEGCGALTSNSNGGVMCCADGDQPPAIPVDDAKTPIGGPVDAKAPVDGKAPTEVAPSDGKAPVDTKAPADAKAPAEPTNVPPPGDPTATMGDAKAKKDEPKKAEPKKSEGKGDEKKAG